MELLIIIFVVGVFALNQAETKRKQEKNRQEAAAMGQMEPGRQIPEDGNQGEKSRENHRTGRRRPPIRTGRFLIRISVRIPASGAFGTNGRERMSWKR